MTRLRVKQHAGYAAHLAVIVLASGCFQEEAPRREAPDAAAMPQASRAAIGTDRSASAATPEPSVRELAETLRYEEDPRVRREAVYSMADAVEAENAAVIGEALTDPEARVRLAAIEAMTGFEGTASADWLSIGLGDPDPMVRRAAVEALGEIGGDSARMLLQQALGDVDPDVRDAAQQMLAEPVPDADAFR